MKSWNTFQIIFIAFCAALNIALGAIVGILKLPLFLDSCGTIIAAALGGWLYGAVVGLLAVLIATVAISPTSWAYGGTAIIIAACVSVLRRYRYLRSLPMTVLGGLLIGIASAIVSAPITTFLYGGVSPTGTDAATAVFKALGNTLMESVILGGLSTDPIDKLTSSLIVLALLKAMPSKLFYRFPYGWNFKTHKE